MLTMLWMQHGQFLLARNSVLTIDKTFCQGNSQSSACLQMIPSAARVHSALVSPLRLPEFTHHLRPTLFVKASESFNCKP
jgi:hypothetical protein